MTQHHNSTPQRRWGDAPHSLGWWLRWIAGICAALLTIAVFLHTVRSFAYGQISGPIIVRLDKLAERDSLRWEDERSARINGDASVSGKLDIVIDLLRERRSH